jgi:hypothetical protein
MKEKILDNAASVRRAVDGKMPLPGSASAHCSVIGNQTGGDAHPDATPCHCLGLPPGTSI